MRFPVVLVLVAGCPASGPGPTKDTSGACTPLLAFRDLDDDGFGGEPVEACDLPADAVAVGGDCDDRDRARSPGAEEVCNGVDDDCDEATDEPDAADAQDWYLDGDGDSFGAGEAVHACAPPPDHVSDGSDCDDGSSAISPASDERCNTIDDDCDLDVDEDDAVDAPTWYADLDHDGFGAGAGAVACAAPPEHVLDPTDCDDARADVSPSGTESCNTIDDDCDSAIDEPDAVDATTWYADHDHDGYGAGAPARACAAPPDHVLDATDCDDGAALVSPSGTERCNHVDDDCDLVIDEDDALDASDWYADGDGDGYGAGSPTHACGAPPEHVLASTDCDDSRADVSPAGVEVCDDVDQDCDASIDEGAVDAPLWYADIDADTHGAGIPVADCDPVDGRVLDATDCDDARDDVFPGGAEVCDGADNDCDVDVDDDPVDGFFVFRDSDGDGHGFADAFFAVCAVPAGYTTLDTDCDDGEASVNPDAAEVCDPLNVDENCTALADDADPTLDAASRLTYQLDVDGDGIGGTPFLSCDAPFGAVATSDDCDDADPTVSPVAVEECDDVDRDCTGDPYDAPSAPPWYADVDGDGFGVASNSVPSCLPLPGRAAVAGDCNDTSAFAYPGAEERCWDLVDEDCDGFSTIATDNDCAPVGANHPFDRKLTQASTVDGAFGADLVFLDFSGDGMDDLAVADTATGVVRVYAGGPTGVASVASLTIEGPAGSFGDALARVADFDGDGIDDLAVGDPAANLDQGRVLIYFGGAWSAAPLTPDAADLVIDGESAGDRAGSALASGDVTGDGLTDLIVGAEEEGYDFAGAAYVVAGGTAPTSLADAHLKLRGETHEESAGSALAVAGDVNADGYDDLLVGACSLAGGDTVAKTFLLHGPLAGGDVDLYFADATIRAATADEDLGCQLRPVGDLDRDGYDDLALGVPGLDQVALFYGPVRSLRLTLDDADQVITGTGDFGAAVAGADIDGDGYSDLVATAPAADSLDGIVYIFYGPIDPAVDAPADANATFDAYGVDEKMAGAIDLGDADGDGYADLAAGSTQGETVTRDGAVYVYRGGSRLEPLGSAPFVDPDDDADGDGWSESEGDCDDTRPLEAPGLEEVCADVLDNDCDGFDMACPLEGIVDVQEVGTGTLLAIGNVVAPTLKPVILGDVNGDGAPDVASGHAANGGAICVELGPFSPDPWMYDDFSDACFDGELNSAGGSAVSGIGDFDGDGIDDFAIAQPGIALSNMTKGLVAVVLGGPHLDGLGTVSLTDVAYVTFSGDVLETYVGSSVTGMDVNGDGLGDLIFGAKGGVGAAYIVYGGRAPGDYTLAEADVRIPGEHVLDQVGALVARAGDVNADGYPDFTVTGTFLGQVWESTGGSSAVYVFLGGPALPSVIDPYDAYATIWGFSFGTSVATGDLDGNGYSDLVIGANSLPGQVRVFFGPLPPGQYLPDEFDVMYSSVVFNERFGVDVAVGDLDADGYDDLIVASEKHPDSNHPLIFDNSGGGYIYHGPLVAGSGGTADADTSLTFISETTSQAWVTSGYDLDLDGIEDLLALGSSPYWTVRLVPGGRRSNLPPHVPPIPDPSDDADGDGFTEVGGDCDDTRAAVAPGLFDVCQDDLDQDCSGADSWCAPIGVMEGLLTAEYSLGVVTAATAADFDQDGRSDIAVSANLVAADELYLSYGPFALGAGDPVQDYVALASNGTKNEGALLATGDIDGDGFPDLLGTVLSEIVVWSGADPSVVLTTFTGFTGMSNFWVGDFDGDGLSDVAVGNAADATNGNLAGGVFLFCAHPFDAITDKAEATAQIYGAVALDRVGEVAAVGDFDADGDDDLVLGVEHAFGDDGAAFVFLSPLTGALSLDDADVELSAQNIDDHLGAGAVAIDTDGDGTPGFAVGATFADRNGKLSVGVVYLFDTLPATGAVNVEAVTMFEGSGTITKLGDQIADLDLDGDGVSDLALAAPGLTSGLVKIYYGPFPSGVVNVAVSDATITGTATFGAVLANAGDTNGDGADELIVGQPSSLAPSSTYMFLGGVGGYGP